MHSCSAGRSVRSLISRTSCTSSSRQRFTTTPATATRLTFISQAIPVAIKRALTVFWSSISLPRSAGKSGKFLCAIFGDFATNFDADDRATAAGHAGGGGQRYAYQAGLGIGQLKKKRDWQFEGLLATPGTILAGSQPDRFRPVQQPAEPSRPRP